MPFHCSICGEESTRLCARCTKDVCANHICEKCLKCSDCCECEVALSPHAPESVREAMHPEPAPLPEREPDPAPVPEREPVTEPPPDPVAEPEPEPVREPEREPEPEIRAETEPLL